MLYLKIPAEVNILLTENWIELKGPLGTIKKKKSNLIKLFFEDNTRKLWFLNKNDCLNHFYISLINKLLWGVWKGYSIKLNIVGVGYKIFLEDNSIKFKIGFSNNIYYRIPQDIKIKILNQKQLTMVILGKDFQKVMQTAAEIKNLKPVEPYKGKGIKFFNEVIVLKEGKKTNV